MMIRKPAGRPMGDTEFLLEQWGWWRLDGSGIPLYTSPALSLMNLALPHTGKKTTYCITDELALKIDRAVAKLCKRDQQMGDIVWLYYGMKWPMMRVAKYYGVSEGKARELARAAVAWVDCAAGTCEIAA
ncbi:antiterminator Q family protein [Pseudomonas sp. B8(2017)]|uniref:antiterminator Q family protein n=1 Tax=Pseudomonas sp. B8(2017) TaxID=1981711 RepID=UPI0014833760|nr:antiterminator Q family protein [Pseudomonas sp. B8(2017)]